MVNERVNQKDLYENVILPSGKSIEAWDEWCEFVGGYGDSRGIADERTYRFGMCREHVQNVSYYDKFLGKTENHPARPGINRAKEAARDAQIRKS